NETERDLPHRTALTDRILKQYDDVCQLLREDFKKALGRLHFTGDLWSTGDLDSHFGITGHFCMRD
ncbi:hypothetical protein DFH06DRAFT_956050, partial [Mycena polygramma]